MKLPALNDFPEYAAVRRRRDELKAEKHAAEQQFAAAHTELERYRFGAAPSAVDAQARALLAGQGVPADPASALRERAADLQQKLQVLNRALELNYTELQAVRARVSRQICAKVAPDHRKLALKVLQSAQTLADAEQAEASFRAELERGGVETGPLPIVRPAGFGSVENPNSKITWLLREAHRAGILALADLPEPVRRIATPKPLPERIRRDRDRSPDRQTIAEDKLRARLATSKARAA
ncbi:MAG: hypothetical protein A3G81_22475 [Betaproteobacteria bacterium RIFCSPLOWO2_12_FULL_65_14]|nr:MAG: hypothetical protein A3G81_22475 [Betaproteobacteria bacterium RIFCSPLOWO2_12_FULL_65_14]